MKKKAPRVLIDSFHLFQALTGIRTYTIQFCSGIEKTQFEDVEYLIYPNWRWVNRTMFLRGKVNVVKKILNHLLYFTWKQLCLPLIILFKRVDLIVAQDYLLPYVKFGAKSIAVIHDTFYWELKGNYNPLWRWYFLKSVRAGLNNKSSIVVTSEYIAKKVKAHVTDQYDISVVYQAPKNLDYSDGETFDLEQWGLPANAKYFLHVGIFESRKNLGVLVNAFSKLLENDQFKDCYLLLAGSRGVGWFHDDFNNLTGLIKDHQLEDRVLMPGFVPNELLGTLYQNAFAYVFPSKEEGFGIPVIEAMKSGIPVIISDQPALMEVAGNAALIFEQDNEEDLYNHMLTLRGDAVRDELIVLGNLRAQKFTQRTFVNKFHEVIVQRLNT